MAIKHILLSIQKSVANHRILWLKNSICVAIIAGFLFSLPLWTGDRLYPQASVFNFPQIPVELGYMLFGALVLTLVGVIFSKNPRIFIFSFVALSAVLIILDQSRMQPWFYQYLFMLLALGFYSWRKEDANGETRVIRACGLIVASIYFFSGIQKINPGFAEQVFPQMIAPSINLFLPTMLHPVIITFGVFIVPFIEIYIGVGLLRKATRKLAIILLIFSVIFILGRLIIINWNSVVWPWNIFMIVFAVIIFWNDKKSELKDYIINKGFKPQVLFVVVFLIMPFLSLFNMWDSYLSATLYSGNVNSAIVSITPDIKNHLPRELKEFTGIMYGTTFFDISGWSMKEMNVPAYPEQRIYKNTARSLCLWLNSPRDLILRISGKPTWFNAGKPVRYSCQDLL